MIPNTPPDSVSAIRFLGNEIAEQRKAVQAWVPTAVPAISVDSIAAITGTYSTCGISGSTTPTRSSKDMRMPPALQAVAGGMRFNFSDRLGATALDVTTSWSPAQQLDP